MEASNNSSIKGAECLLNQTYSVGKGTERNKKSPRDIIPHICPPSPQGAKYVTVNQDTSPSLCSERHNKYLFG